MIIRTFFLTALIITSLSLRVVGDDPPLESSKTVEQLIKELGDDSFKVRKAARESLLKRGQAARRALMVMKDTDDPEVRSAVNDLLLKLRGQIVPGAEMEIKELFLELDAGEKGSELWKSIARINADHMAELLLEVSRNDSWGDALETGMFTFLASANPIKSAGIINGFNDEDRKTFIRILDRTNGASYEMKPRQMKLLYCLGDNPRTVNRAFGVWELKDSQQALDLAAMAIGRSDDPMKFWSMGGRKIFFEDNLEKRCKLMSFYCGVAQRLGKTHLVRGFMSLGGVDGAEGDYARKLLSVLEKTGDEELVTRFLNGCQGVAFKYETLYRFYRDNDGEFSKEEWESIVSGTKGEAGLYDLFTVVARYNISHAQDLLQRIISMDPKGSNYDDYAYTMLARYAEGTGQIAKAAEFWRETVTIGGQDGRLSRTDKATKIHAEELRKAIPLENEAYSKLMLAGRQLELDGDEDGAVAEYQKAVALAPNLPHAYERMISIYRDQGYYQKHNELTTILVQQKPLTTRDKLDWSYKLSNLGKLDEAQAMLEEYSKAEDAVLYEKHPAAILQERMGNMKEAEAAYAELLRRVGAYSTVRRQYALVKIKLRKLDEAEALLMDHLLEQPFDQYARLLLYYSRLLNKADDAEELKRYIHASGTGQADWIYWLLSHATGEVSDEVLIAKADEIDEASKHYGQKCEALFYCGIKALANANTDRAKELFEKTVNMNITIYIEHNWAIHELNSLKSKQ